MFNLLIASIEFAVSILVCANICASRYSYVVLHMKPLIFLALSLLIFCTSYSYAAPDGAALYEANCAACHQINGGGIGLPLSVSKLSTVTDDYIRLTIRNGRKGRIMPAFTDLSDAQIDAITAFIRSWSGKPAPKYPDAPVLGDSDRGRVLYQNYCSNCHGEDGNGQGLGTGVTYSRGRKFAVMPPAIGNQGFLASASNQMIKQVIMRGRPGTEMQSFSNLGLKEQDVNDIVRYVRSFQRWDTHLAAGVSPGEKPKPALVFESDYDFETTINNIKEAIKGRNFRYLPDRLLEQGLIDPTDINDRQMTIRYCNFNQLYELIRIEPRLGVGLPCRITVIERADRSVQIIAMNIQLIATLFNNDQLLEMSKEYHEIQLEIIEEATL